MRFKLVVFDFDGTLASTIEGITVCMRQALESFGYPAPSDGEIRATVGLTLEHSIKQLTNSACEDFKIPAVVRCYRDLYVTQGVPRTRLFDGTEDMLKAVKTAQIKTVLLSNKGNSGLLQLLHQLEIDSYFDLVLGADRVKYHKPSSDLYEAHVASEFPDLAPEETLIVGDTESDLCFAANIGARSCWARYGYGNTAACEALKPDFTISAIKELTDFVFFPENSLGT
jgi:phosphoglycolate phosphatase